VDKKKRTDDNKAGGKIKRKKRRSIRLERQAERKRRPPTQGEVPNDSQLKLKKEQAGRRNTKGKSIIWLGRKGISIRMGKAPIIVQRKRGKGRF